MSITEKLMGLISEITQLEKDNKTLNEQLLDLEKDKTEGYKSFDTETHILVEKEFLKGICGAAEDASYEAEQAREEARANTMLAAMQYAGDEQQRQAQLGSGMLASGYVPQAQLIGALQPGMTASERGRQAIAQQTGAYGQTYASGLQALLASAVGQGNILGQAGGAIAESALGGLFSGLGKI